MIPAFCTTVSIRRFRNRYGQRLTPLARQRKLLLGLIPFVLSSRKRSLCFSLSLLLGGHGNHAENYLRKYPAESKRASGTHDVKHSLHLLWPSSDLYPADAANHRTDLCRFAQPRAKIIHQVPARR